ncbi:GtrA family protein [Trinickia sp. EG282A]|uniref:GtrA family protein n=1 Tax=Trinickia sp. EG282A TaxID=3237013 RepID=UPI0034D1D2E6
MAALLSAFLRTRVKTLRYLLVGGVNTAFGYCVNVGLYYALHTQQQLFAICLLANVVCITEAFFLHRLFVFKSREPWLREYLRCYAVYGSTMLVATVALWLLVDALGVPFWFAQMLVLTISVAVSFIGHDQFTFKKVRGENERQKADHHRRGML